jgi:lysophospholipase L1-like esterase
MRVRSITIILATLGVLMESLATTNSSAAPAPGKIYLALGDSFAASMQPSGDSHSGFEYHNGYAEQVFQLEQARFPDLRLMKLGCPGERTSTIARPRRLCPQPEGSQLDQAVAVLEGGDVAFVTLQIGTNDTFQCFNFHDSAFDQACIDDVLPKIAARLTSIVETLRGADPDVPIVGSNYYDALLAAWTAPGFPPESVRQIAQVWTAINDTLEQTYAALGVPVADVEAAFSSADFDTMVNVRGFGDLPLNVARICEWAYTCSDEFDHDFHPTTFGYSIMTRAWEEALVTALEPAA